MGFSQYVMMHEVTQVASKGAQPSILPFVKYLEEGKPFSGEVRAWLLALLSKQGRHGVRLRLEQTKGRPPAYTLGVAAELEAFEEYNELCQTKVTRALCDRYARLLRTPPVRLDRQLPKRGKKADARTNTVYIIEVERRNIRLKTGKVVPKLSALALVAARFNRSPDSLRKALVKIDRAYSA